MFVYAMRGGGYAKIGVSDDIEKRLASFNRGSLPFEMTIVCLAETSTDRALEIEAALLSKLPGRLLGEWLGSTSDADLIAAFEAWTWDGRLMVTPTADEVRGVNRSTAMQRQMEASRAVAKVLDTKMPAGVDWRRIATELTASGEKGAVMQVKKAFKAKRLAAQRRVSG